MNKAGLFLKWGFVAIAATFYCSTVMAQSVAKTPGRKDVGAQSAQQINAASTKKTNSTHQPLVVQSRVDSKLVSKTRGGVVIPPSGKKSRNCTPKTRENPFSITRANFEKMPADRQEFVRNHSDKYIIVD